MDEEMGEETIGIDTEEETIEKNIEEEIDIQEGEDDTGNEEVVGVDINEKAVEEIAGLVLIVD